MAGYYQNVGDNMKNFTFETADQAWFEINKKFLNQDEELFEEGQGAVITGSLFSYGLTFLIKNASFDPEFDFGRMMGYTQSKWTSLLNNYVDLDALDQLKLLVRELEKNKAVNRNYHVGFNFADSHGNGKGCLVSGMFSRMIYIDKPRLTIVMRASEVVTRLPWDLLLACRMGEYVYGHTEFSIEVIMRSAFADDITMMLLNGYSPIEELIDNIPNEERKKRMRKVLRKVKRASEEGNDPKYQAYTRVYKIFNPEAYAKNMGDKKKKTGPVSFLAKDCIIGNWDGIPLPEECPSIMVRNQIKKVYLKFIKKYNLDIFAQADKSKKVVNFNKKKAMENALASDDIEDDNNGQDADFPEDSEE